jgi:tetratricopeptide (TPR) repeat protein
MTPDDFRQAMAAAIRQHEAGNLSVAERMYRQILCQQPEHPDVLHLLGAALGQQGKLDEAIAMINQAVAKSPRHVVYLCNLSEFCRRAGRADEAIAAARSAIAADPNQARAYCMMGSALTLQRRFDDAIAAFRRAIQLNPNYEEALSHLGNTLNSLEQYGDAIPVFRRLCTVNPRSADALGGLAAALRSSGQLGEAITLLQRAVELTPGSSPTHNNLGIALGQADRIDEAIAAFRKAIEVQPGNALAVKNLGVALAEKGLFHESLAALDRAIELKSDLAEAHGNRALILLVLGDFERGWPEYEWRWRAQLTTLSTPRSFSQPRWDGSKLDGRSILLHAEQGFGDTLQFVRYIPMVVERGGRVILDCPLDLVRLLARMPGISRVIATGETLPDFYCQCPLLSLPLLFDTRLETIPAKIPYLTPDPALVEKWKARFDAEPVGKLRVGLVWAGNVKNKHDRKRSMTLEQLAPLAEVADVQFFSLQKGRPLSSPPPMAMTDWTGDLVNFDETAAMVSQLDLVIAVDTAVAHLAGAMGKPVWIMISYVPDWRWMLNRADSPWYPTLRIFRQSRVGDWTGVVERVKTALAETALQQPACAPSSPPPASR